MSASNEAGEFPREWLEVDGLGGYAFGTVEGPRLRRYHGLLVAVEPHSKRRFLFLADVDAGPDGEASSRGGRLQREVACVRGRPAVLVRFTWEGKVPTTVHLAPLLAFRDADALTVKNPVLVPTVQGTPYGIRAHPYSTLPALDVTLACPDGTGWTFQPDPTWREGLRYPVDEARGYRGHEDLFSPGHFRVDLAPGQSAVLAASIDGAVTAPAEAWNEAVATRPAASEGSGPWRARVAAGADDFLYTDAHGRRGILAGFPWFGEWGRDTFIALPGLTLARGRMDEAEAVLDGAAAYLWDGLLPNIFGASVEDSHYGSVDASLFFARAALLYDRAGGDEARVLERYRPMLEEIATAYAEGQALGVVRLGIRGDDEGLIRVGSPGLNLTWMDAQTDDGPVTPRYGYPVEIEALWCSLLSTLVEWSERAGDAAAARRWRVRADRADTTFLERFWREDEGVLLDVWRREGSESHVRPNMVLAAALEHTPLDPAQRRRILSRATRDLLTPYGLRTLAPDEAAYQPRYEGDARRRDHAYHQGTVWPWLLGFYTEASLRIDASEDERRRLKGLWGAFETEVDRAGLNHISEVYDADPPHRPGGTIAQAWNTGELLRAFALIDGTLPLSREGSA